MKPFVLTLITALVISMSGCFIIADDHPGHGHTKKAKVIVVPRGNGHGHGHHKHHH